MEKTPINLSKGLYLDNNEEFQPPGTYRFALNAIFESLMSERGGITNELGNSNYIQFNDDIILLGSCLLPNNDVVLFLKQDQFDIIGLQSDDKFKILIKTNCLNFNECKFIDCKYKIHNGCETIIYFTDTISKYKSINISKLNKYVKQGYDAYDNINTGGILLDPNQIDFNNNFGWECGLFYLNSEYLHPDIYLKSILSGGSLKLGTYLIFIRYLDDDYNPTNWIGSFGPINVNTITSQDPLYNQGGILKFDEDGYYNTDKTIQLILKNLDTRYFYYQIGVACYDQGLDTVSSSFVSKRYKIENSETEFLIPNFNDYTNIALNELTTDFKTIEIVQAHTQVDNRLILANLDSRNKDFSIYQRIANEINCEYFTYTKDHFRDVDICDYNLITLDDTPNDNKIYNQPIVTYDNRTYMRDEVYAMGIVFVYKDGSESPVFHIPGRKKIGTPIDIYDTSCVTSLTIDSRVYNSEVGRIYWNNLGNDDDNFYPLGDSYNITQNINQWDTRLYGFSTTQSGYRYEFPTTVDFIHNNISLSENIFSFDNCQDEVVNRWQFVNTSIKYDYNLDNIINLWNSFNYKHKYTPNEMGLCAYFETDTLYPEIKDCNGTPIYPHDILSNGTYRMHRIRHHKIPDSRKSKIFNTIEFDNDSYLKSKIQLYPIGLRFSNINIPNDIKSKIQGYYIVRGDRSFNKTVIDKGWLNVCDSTIGIKEVSSNFETHNLSSDTKVIAQNTLFMEPSKLYHESGSISSNGGKAPNASLTGYDVVEFFSPKTSYGNSLVKIDAQYYKIENTIQCRFHKNNQFTIDNSDNTSDFPDEGGLSPYNWKFKGQVFTDKMFLPRSHQHGNRNQYTLQQVLPIDYSEYMLYNTDVYSSFNESKLYNGYHKQNIMYSKLFRQNLEPNIYNKVCVFNTPLSQAIINSSGQIISGWASLLEKKTQSDGSYFYFALDLNIIRNGDEDYVYNIGQNERFNKATYLYYAAIKSNIIPYKKLEDIKYIKTTNYIIESNNTHYAITGGDCTISKQQLFKSYMRKSDNHRRFAGTSIIGYIESEINGHIRFKEQGSTMVSFPWNSVQEMIDQVSNKIEDSPINIPQSYDYRLDFSTDKKLKYNFSLNDGGYDFCSDCTNKFPHTLYYSDMSLNDQVNDNYRLFRANNEGNISSDTGDIIDLFVKDTSLFIHTENNLWRINLAPQELETSNDTVQIGAGTLLTAKPVKLFDNQNSINVGGIEIKKSAVMCENNYIWVDSVSNRIFALSDSPKEISSIGMKMWFNENLDLTLRKQFKKLTDFDFPYLDTTCNKGIGFMSCYDPKFRRYILHKRDYEIPSSLLNEMLPISTTPYIVGKTYYDKSGFYFAISQTELIECNYDTQFINKSWTISYSLIDNCWLSWHSYRPNFLYNDNYNFYSTALHYEYNNSIWKHNSNLFQTFYDYKEDFILDYISMDNPYSEKTVDTIEYSSNVYLYDSISKNWIEKQFVTFDRVYVYNNNQNSGLKSITVNNLIPYQTIQYSPINISANKDRNIWRISRLRDYSINRNTESMFSNEWNLVDYSSLFSPNLGYIDKVINPNFLNIFKNSYQLERFTDKYLGIRFYFKPIENYKILINILSNLKRQRV